MQLIRKAKKIKSGVFWQSRSLRRLRQRGNKINIVVVVCAAKFKCTDLSFLYGCGKNSFTTVVRVFNMIGYTFRAS